MESERPANVGKAPALLEGELLVHTLFGFQRKHCKLYDNRIKIGYKLKERFNLTYSCSITENSRAFCLLCEIMPQASASTATDTYFQKDEWFITVKKRF